MAEEFTLNKESLHFICKYLLVDKRRKVAAGTLFMGDVYRDKTSA
jgi:hypothetical protein